MGRFLLRIARQALFATTVGTISLAVTASELHSYALVQDDASLLVRGKTVHLYGVHIPPTERKCRSNIRPVRCASRAALALDFKVQGFVHCFVRGANPDRSLNAVCYVDRSSFDEGVDLAAYLIEHGWALALPEAPFEYQALEKIARHNNRGVWGFSVDTAR
jgi:endonuclease YncB( thermonuclease family)